MLPPANTRRLGRAAVAVLGGDLPYLAHLRRTYGDAKVAHVAQAERSIRDGLHHHRGTHRGPAPKCNQP